MGRKRFNAYRVMWIFVFFDLPTYTKKERKAASDFRNRLVEDGFNMFQFSVYIRHCASKDNADVHMRRVKGILPKDGKVGMVCITDKQFGMMDVFIAEKKKAMNPVVSQLELF